MEPITGRGSLSSAGSTPFKAKEGGFFFSPGVKLQLGTNLAYKTGELDSWRKMAK
jgi:hypothetical protein